MKKYWLILLLFICKICAAQNEVEINSNENTARKSSRRASRNVTKLIIPFAGNAFITKKDKNCKEEITENGLQNWTSKNTILSIYFKSFLVYSTLYYTNILGVSYLS